MYIYIYVYRYRYICRLEQVRCARRPEDHAPFLSPSTGSSTTRAPASVLRRGARSRRSSKDSAPTAPTSVSPKARLSSSQWSRRAVCIDLLRSTTCRFHVKRPGDRRPELCTPHRMRIDAAAPARLVFRRQAPRAEAVHSEPKQWQ